MSTTKTGIQIMLECEEELRESVASGRARQVTRALLQQVTGYLDAATARRGVDVTARVVVHADGGACHGTPLVDGRCPGCGAMPDMQSTEVVLARKPTKLTGSNAMSPVARRDR